MNGFEEQSERPEAGSTESGRTEPSAESSSEQPGTRPAGHGVTVPEAREVTKATAADFRHLVGRYVRRHLPTSTSASVPQVAEPPRSAGSSGMLLSLLKVIPLTLGALFVVSFFWDFPGMTLTILGREMALSGLLRIVAVSGLIGFLTNWIAITMLFNPRTERPLFGQGLIPAQRERVIYRLASAVSEELINEEIIKQKIEENEIIPKYREMALSVTRGVLEDDEFRTDLKKLTGDYVQTVLTSDEVRRRIVEFVIEKIENYVGEGMGGFALKAYRYVNEQDFQRRIDRAITMLPDQLDIVLDDMDALLDRIPEKIEARAEDIEEWATKIVLGFVENLDVYSMIMSNMMQYDERRLEELIKKSTNEQLNYIKYLGGALGALGGLVIWQPVPALVAFGIVGSLMWGADEALYRLGRSRSGA
ncbi:MAG: DUF445 family protein [Rhodothermales bacterium]|nr:DUF445 family protein [Rhodothermales bacterium]